MFANSPGPLYDRETCDDHGAFSAGLGPALFVGYLVRWLIPSMATLGAVLVFGLVAAALARGHRIERARLNAQGMRRARGLLELLSTWAIVLLAAMAAGALLTVAHARVWHFLPGWVDGPIYAALWLGTAYASAGARDRVWRWAVVGAALCLVAVFIPVVAATPRHAYLAAALMMGGVLSIAGHFGQQTLDAN